MAITLVDKWYPLGDGSSANEWQWQSQNQTLEAQTAVKVENGDIILMALHAAAAPACLATPSGGGLTWNALGSAGGSHSELNRWALETGVGNANQSGVAAWSAAVSGSSELKPKIVMSNMITTTNMAITVQVIRGAKEIGTVKFGTNDESTTQPSLTMTTKGNGSWVSTRSVDWQAGLPALPTWESTGAGSGVMDVSHRDEPAYNVYAGHFAESGAAGSKTFKLTGTERWVMFAVELIAEEEKEETLQELVPDEDLATEGWTSTPLFSKLNDGSDASTVKTTLA